MLPVEVPVRDGVVLRGLRYRPEVDQAPVVLSTTPYGADRFHADGKYFAGRGFNYVTLDSRGRGDSTGTFEPFVNDGIDGYDAVEWLANQSWSTGEIVLHGGSYGGFVQWATAAAKPPHLRAIAPVASVYPGFDFPMVRNIPVFYAIRWLTLLEGHRMNQGPFADEQLWGNAARAISSGDHPYRDLDLLTIGRRHPVFQQWLDHPDCDDYWLARTPRAELVEVPVLTITGQYDDDQLGALRYYAEYSGDRHDLVIGPWDHGATRTSATSFGGLTFAPQSAVNLPALHADWYDSVLDRGARPAFLADRVTYFHITEDRWRSAPSLSMSTDIDVAVQHPGELSLAPSDRKVPRLTDPLQAGDFVAITDPFARPVDLTGRIKVALTIAADVSDFDLLIAVHLLTPDPVLLGDTVVRAGYRDSLSSKTPWPQAENIQLDVELPFLSRRLNPGNKLAVVVQPPHRRYQPNPVHPSDTARVSNLRLLVPQRGVPSIPTHIRPA